MNFLAVKNEIKKLWKDESAQGATEYILLLVAVVALVVIFKEKITGLIQSAMGSLSGKVNGVIGE